MNRAGGGMQSANPLIALRSSPVAQPVLISEPDPGTVQINPREIDG
jgi:hypothetical protein